MKFKIVYGRNIFDRQLSIRFMVSYSAYVFQDSKLRNHKFTQVLSDYQLQHIKRRPKRETPNIKDKG